MKHVGIDIKFDNLDTFNKQIDVRFIDVDSEWEDLNYKVASSIFCHVWRSIFVRKKLDKERMFTAGQIDWVFLQVPESFVFLVTWD